MKPTKPERPMSFMGSMDRMFGTKVNMSETAKEIKVEVEVPGCEAKDIEVKIEGNVLSVHAKKEETKEKKDEKKHYYYRESSSREFSRMMMLPEHIDASRAISKAKNGMLTIVIPKKSVAQSKPTVKVKVS